MGHADRPGRLGRQGVRRAHRAPRGHPRRQPGGDRRRRRAAARDRASWASTPRSASSTGATPAPDAIINEIREAATTRHTALLADPPTDGDGASPTPIFGGVPWNWRTLLRNRPLDVWMHEQDVRRAVGRPGGMDTRAGQAHRGVPRREPRLRARQEGRRTGRHHAWSSTWRAASRSRSRSTTTAAASGCHEPPTEPDGDAADGPRGVHPAGRRPLRRRARRGHRRRRPGARRAGSSPRSPPPRDMTASRRLAARRHPRPGRAGPSWSPARRWAGSATTPLSSWPAAAPGWSSPAAARSRLDETARDHPRRGARRPSWSSSSVDLADLGSVRRAAARGRGVRPDRRAGQQRRRDGHARTTVTADGLDLQLATNHFGPFLLTGLLLPQLRRQRGRRPW